jgi:putative heme-binding domain-containing protein
VFTNTCAPCHTLYGQGGKIGPDLTGGERRHNLDSLLAKITDPSSELPTDSRYTILKLKDGRTLAGMVANRTDTMLTLKSITETSTVALNEIQSTEVLPISLMPEGLFENLNPTQRRDLVGYLMSDSPGRGPGRGRGRGP